MSTTPEIVDRVADANRPRGWKRAVAAAWRDGLFVAIACGGFARAIHIIGEPHALMEDLRSGGGMATMLTPAAIADASLPFLVGVCALVCPLLWRLRWQAGTLALGLGWLGLVGLALLQERVLGHSLPVFEGALGCAALVGLTLVLKASLVRVKQSMPQPEASAPAAA